MIKTIDFKETLEHSFLVYAEEVALNRSIPSAEDGLKLSMRQGLYAQYSHKLTHGHKYQKAIKSVAAAMGQSYVHGDIPMYETLIRAAKPWAYRYPLEEAQGAYGSPCAPDDQSAARYVELRSSALADNLFEGLKKHAITEWYDNYDGTEKIPFVMPSAGFWPLVNGASGIAVGFGTSIPPINLREANEAMITLIDNPDTDPAKVICMPDFPSGCTIINGRETKDSLIKGTGAACRMRATLEYNEKENYIRCTHLPFSVFTNTVLGELEKLSSGPEGLEYGILKVIDHTKQEGDIRIYIDKRANPAIMINKLYHDTSLESFYSINMVMLDHGRYPKVFSQKDAFLAYINHLRDCKINEINYDIDVLQRRNHILEGLLIALEDIDNVIALIKSARNAAIAKQELIKKYSLDEEQAKAILDIKLSRLAHMESIELRTEFNKNIAEISRLKNILGSPAEMNVILKKMLTDVAKTFGDARRTQIRNLADEVSEELEQDEVTIIITKDKYKITHMPLGSRGIKASRADDLVIFTDNGMMYTKAIKELPLDKSYMLSSLVDSGRVVNIIPKRMVEIYKYVILVTKRGYARRTTMSEFKCARSKKGRSVAKLHEGDLLVSVLLSTNESDMLGIYNSEERYHNYPISEIPLSGKNSFGIKGNHMGANAYVIEARLNVPEYRPAARQFPGLKFNENSAKKAGIAFKSAKGEN